MPVYVTVKNNRNSKKSYLSDINIENGFVLVDYKEKKMTLVPADALKPNSILNRPPFSWGMVAVKKSGSDKRYRIDKRHLED